ncbi:MAG: alpha/beta fold hydrolase [Solirubrobacteraceae bacterium]
MAGAVLAAILVPQGIAYAERLAGLPAVTGLYTTIACLVGYAVFGSGSPLVLLHGGALTVGLTFGPMIPALAESHRVIAVEIQGHGHTADIDREMTLESFADDIVTLLGQLGIEQADLLGTASAAASAWRS